MRSRNSRTPRIRSGPEISCIPVYSSRKSAPAENPAVSLLQMISACASRAASRDTNSSSSSSMTVPISLAGARCSASSMTPSFSSHDSASPVKVFMCVYDSTPVSRRLLGPIQVLNLVLQSRRNQIPLQLPIRGQQTIFHRERLRVNMEGPHLLVVRFMLVHRVDSGLHTLRLNLTGDDRRKIAATISDQHNLLRAGNALQ